MQYIIAASALFASAMALPTAQADSTPPATPENYLIKKFHAGVSPGSIINEFSFEITTNENGETPFTTKCSGSSSTTPVMSYLGWTACQDPAIEFAWATAAGADKDFSSYYQLYIKDNKGFNGTHSYEKSNLKEYKDSPEGMTSYVMDVNENLDIPRVRSTPTSL